MAYIKSSSGTPDQLLRAVKQQLATLEGSDITSATDYNMNDDIRAIGIEATSGSPDELLNAVKDKIADLDGDSITSSTDMYEDCDGCIAGPGAQLSLDELRNMWDSNHEGDPSMVTYPSFDAWLSDSVDNGFLKPIDSACNSCNIMSTADLSIEDQEKLYEIADRYVGSEPVSGNWTTEAIHEQEAIADEFGVSLEEAKQMMIEYLGFTDDMFVVESAANEKYDEVTYDVVEASTDDDNYQADYVDRLEQDLDTWSQEDKFSDVIESINYEDDANNLYMTVTADKQVNTYTIPFEDLSFDYDNISKDKDYILESVIADLNKIKKTSEPIESSIYDEVIPEDYEGGYTEWDMIDTKQVQDSDGFWTDYTLWHNTVTGIWECTFGDREIYYPENTYADAEFETEDEAREWFECYTGFADDKDDIEY